MTLNVLFAGAPARWDDYRRALTRAIAAAGLKARVATDIPPGEVDYIVYAPNGPVQDFGPYTRLRAVLGLWAGVEKVVNNPTLRVPMTRMVDAGLRAGMVEYVTGHVLRYHLGMDAQIVNPDHAWTPVIPPLARDRAVAILGLGELGTACARALARLEFRVAGWSRRPKTIPAVTSLHGDQGLKDILATAEILVLLLPLTPATENLLNAQRLAQLPRGARIINPGRGALIDDDALLDALDSGHVAHATLDVFRQEPLPPDHRFWTHPQITVTPHVASDTRPETAALVVAENIRRAEAGEDLLYAVDRAEGY